MTGPLRTSWVLMAVLVAPSAQAADGIIEINETCAVSTGCFAGDTPGYPVQIDGSAGQSYRLTSDLKIPNENTHGIQITSGNISIDLAGFEIRGPVVCSGTPLVCSPNAGTGTGIFVTSLFNFPGVSVRRGSVRGMGSVGISLSAQSEVSETRVRWNRGVGIQVGAASTVVGNMTYQNGGDGISAGTSSIVTGNTIYQNGVRGLFSGHGATISGNSVHQNALSGLATIDGSTVTGNSVRLNGGAGIVIGSTSSAANNSVVGNGGGGIVTGTGSTVRGNSVGNNTGFGLVLGSESGYRENVIQGNTTGAVDGTGFVNLGDNACNGTNVCP